MIKRFGLCILAMHLGMSAGVMGEVGNVQMCDGGQEYCVGCGKCVYPGDCDSCTSAQAPVALAGNPGTIYLLPPGTSVICKSGELKELSPTKLPQGDTVSQWSCPTSSTPTSGEKE
jgi:hypothetical protein